MMTIVADGTSTQWGSLPHFLSIEAAQTIARKYVSGDVGHKASALIDYLDDCQRRLAEFGIATVPAAPPVVSAYPNEPGAVFNAEGLIPVTMGEVGGRNCPVVNARELHEFMGVARDFSNWIKGRIAEYEFTEKEDYTEFSPNLAKNTRGRPTINYHLTLDMAKELAMVERNDKGKQIRRYFIECERQVLEGRMSSWAVPAMTRTASTESDPEEADSATPSTKTAGRKTTPGTQPSGNRPKPRGRK